jgi:hypothetical protein
MPVQTPLGRFPNSHLAAEHCELPMSIFWHRVMSPLYTEYYIIKESNGNVIFK